MAAPRMSLVASMVVLLCVSSCTSASEGQAREEGGARQENRPPPSKQSNSQSVPKTPSIPEDAINGDPVNKEAPVYTVTLGGSG